MVYYTLGCMVKIRKWTIWKLTHNSFHVDLATHAKAPMLSQPSAVNETDARPQASFYLTVIGYSYLAS